MDGNACAYCAGCERLATRDVAPGRLSIADWNRLLGLAGAARRQAPTIYDGCICGAAAVRRGGAVRHLSLAAALYVTPRAGYYATYADSRAAAVGNYRLGVLAAPR